MIYNIIVVVAFNALPGILNPKPVSLDVCVRQCVGDIRTRDTPFRWTIALPLTQTPQTFTYHLTIGTLATIFRVQNTISIRVVCGFTNPI